MASVLKMKLLNFISGTCTILTGLPLKMYVITCYHINIVCYIIIKQVLEYTVSNLQELSTNTYTFRDAMFDSSLPWQLVDSAAGRVSVIRSPSAMWLADGNFYCFEGYILISHYFVC